ncbi:MAG: single-stranded DNA-binding protein [Acutalibacteraceae bacterium]
MLNQVVLIGRLTADPVSRTTESGKSVCSFCIAVGRGYVKQGQERKADFINIVAWQQTADFVCRYFQKGGMIAVVGQLQSRQYEDKAGNKRTAFEVIAREISFCGGSGKKQDGGEFKPEDLKTGHEGGWSNATAADFEEITDDEDLPF